MKLYTNTLKGLLAGMLALTLISCSSSSDLSFPNPNNPDEQTATIQLLVTGIESDARTDLGIFLRAVATMGREAYYFEPSDPRYTGELLTGPIDPGGFLTSRPWAARYRVIKDCNLLLDRAAEKNDNGAAGFAKTWMAYEMLLNLNYTDTNGIRTDVAGEIPGPFVDKTAALAYIASQLDSGYSDLQNAGGSFTFSVSSGLANFNTPSTFGMFNRAIKARVASYQEDYTALTAALNASFIDENGSMSDGVYHVYSTGSGDQLNPMYEPSANPDTTIRLHAHPSFIADAEPGDGRVTSKTAARPPRTYDGLEADHGAYIYKSSVDPLPIIRNEELLLLRAEANLRGSANLAAAEADINTVRAAAGLGPISIADVNSGIQQLLHERRYSLWLEGHRWVDMRRSGLLNTLPVDRATDTVIPRMPIPLSEQVGSSKN